MGPILVATDGSPAARAALEAAVSLASETGDDIEAITVWRALQGDYGLHLLRPRRSTISSPPSGNTPKARSQK